MVSNENRLNELLEPFPSQNEKEAINNPAIRLYGRRFYKDQTSLEYLTEFLLVFASPKLNPEFSENTNYSYSFDIDFDTPRYWAENRVALKLFAFFPSSKLETRHSTHKKAYLEIKEVLETHVFGSADKKEATVRLLQSFLSGFVGVAKNRTWATYCFLPVSRNLLASELVWSHEKALKDVSIQNWRDSAKYFSSDRHIYMARGGELLFLQLANLFSDPNASDLTSMLANDNYRHFDKNNLENLAQCLKRGLHDLLTNTLGVLPELIQMIENILVDFQLDVKPTYANLGWVPKASRIEALLFAQEMQNICAAMLSPLEKLDLLKLLCSMQVLRSLCFQARRVDSAENHIPNFIGNYAWIVSEPEANSGSPIRLMAQTSFSYIEALLFRVIRNGELVDDNDKTKQKEADKNGFHIFRKIAKEIGLVTPRNGGGQRFVLTPELLCFLVAALLQPGERVRLTEFYRRAFAHYGLALGGDALNAGLEWCGNAGKKKSYAPPKDTLWIEEALQQGGFLVELSDAVSMVYNPGTARKSA